jgi:transcription initiation factor TFIIIB Brf1 subunit/transcription initiation factor TFIIB
MSMYVGGRGSREQALEHGRRQIQQIAAAVRARSHIADGAHKLYMRALMANFVQGRRSNAVAAVSGEVH